LSFTADQTAFFAILLAALVLLMTEWLRTDVVALLLVLGLAGSGLLEPREALSGFSSEPAIVVAGIFVLSAGLHATGVSDRLATIIGRLAGNGFARVIAVIMPSTALMSAVTHHLTMTAVMLPVTLQLAREKRIAPSKLLMPLSFAASLGTTIAIIGAPAFLIASGVLAQSGRPGLDLFSIAPIGLALTAAGTLYALLARRLLPQRPGTVETADRFRMEGVFTELALKPTSPFIHRTLEQIEADRRYDLDVVGWIREGERLSLRDRRLRAEPGDVLLIQTSAEQLVTFRDELAHELRPVSRYASERESLATEDAGPSALMAQAVVAPHSALVGRTLREVEFRERFGVIVLGIWRRHGWLRDELSKIPLAAGDVLVLHGGQADLRRIEDDPAFLLLAPIAASPRHRRRAPLAALIMASTILLTVTHALSIELAALTGALAMVLTRCIPLREAYSAVDTRIFVFIAGAMPLGLAMKKTGSADLLAGWLQRLTASWDELGVLLALFLLVAVVTQLMSDAATTALFAPVAVAFAQARGSVPEPYVVTVAMAAVASFLTPVGHHGNLLVYAPGGYRFRDFVVFGTPLTLIIALLVALIAPLLW
jgi:di/tricarboxylate transporter